MTDFIDNTPPSYFNDATTLSNFESWTTLPTRIRLKKIYSLPNVITDSFYFRIFYIKRNMLGSV